MVPNLRIMSLTVPGSQVANMPPACTAVRMPYLTQGQNRFGYAGTMIIPSWFKPISTTMSVIEGKKINEMLITDFGAMVSPRTLLEFVKRGFDSARETLFREMMGLFNNTVMAGILGGGLVYLTYMVKRFNPKAMSLSAHMDVNRIQALSQLASDVLNAPETQHKTAQELQQTFLKKLFGGLRSSDNIHNVLHQPNSENLKALQPYGKHLRDHLDHKHIEGLVKRYLGKEAGFEHMAQSVDTIVADRTTWAVYREEVDRAVNNVEVAFRKARKNRRLSASEEKLLGMQKLSARKVAEKKQLLDLRSIVTKEFRAHDKAFLQSVYDYAVKGHLTDQVYWVDAQGKSVLGRQALNDVLKDTKYFMEEMLNRGLHEAGVLSKPGAIGSNGIQNTLQRLFGPTGPQNWLQKTLLAHSHDGLVRYAYKSKYWLVILPVVLTASFSACVVLINNAITRKKYGGREFFPGEEVFKGAGEKIV